MSKLSIDCPICLNFHHRKTKFNLCSHSVCNECAYKMLTKLMNKCPICRANIELGLIPDTTIVVDECFETKQTLFKEEEPQYYDDDDSDADSDNNEEQKYYNNYESDNDSDND